MRHAINPDRYAVNTNSQRISDGNQGRTGYSGVWESPEGPVGQSGLWAGGVVPIGPLVVIGELDLYEVPGRFLYPVRR